MNIECNKCHEKKDIKKETYDKMISRYAFVTGFTIGLTRGIPSIFDKSFLIKEKDKPSTRKELILKTKELNPTLEKALSESEIEELFLENYICRECKSESRKLSELIQELRTKLLSK